MNKPPGRAQRRPGQGVEALSRVDQRVDLSLARTGLVRYDAYKDAGGQQSASVALLDSGRTGIVLSAIQGRDYARIYLKELDRGRASVALSPEELEGMFQPFHSSFEYST